MRLAPCFRAYMHGGGGVAVLHDKFSHPLMIDTSNFQPSVETSKLPAEHTALGQDKFTKNQYKNVGPLVCVAKKATIEPRTNSFIHVEHKKERMKTKMWFSSLSSGCQAARCLWTCQRFARLDFWSKSRQLRTGSGDLERSAREAY